MGLGDELNPGVGVAWRVGRILEHGGPVEPDAGVEGGGDPVPAADPVADGDFPDGVDRVGGQPRVAEHFDPARVHPIKNHLVRPVPVPEQPQDVSVAGAPIRVGLGAVRQRREGESASVGEGVADEKRIGHLKPAAEQIHLDDALVDVHNAWGQPALDPVRR